MIKIPRISATPCALHLLREPRRSSSAGISERGPGYPDAPGLLGAWLESAGGPRQKPKAGIIWAARPSRRTLWGMLRPPAPPAGRGFIRS